MELDAKLLMTVPGVNVTVALGLLAAIGDEHRVPAPSKLAADFDVVPITYQSGDTCHHGGITKQGRSHARWLAIEAAQSVAMSSAPLSANAPIGDRARSAATLAGRSSCGGMSGPTSAMHRAGAESRRHA